MIERFGKSLPELGWLVLACALVLTALGLLGVYVGEAELEGPLRQTIRQIGFLGVGLLAFFGVQLIGYRELGRWSYAMYLVTLILLTLLIVARAGLNLAPFIVERRNAYRWIFVGPINFQISELAKVTHILALSYYLRYRTNYRTFGGLFMPFVLTLIPVALILKEPDLGTSLLLLPNLFVMLFVAGAKIRHLAVIVLLGAIAAPCFYYSTLMSDYQRDRILAVVHQRDDNQRWKLNEGYQLHQSKIALGSGRIAGQGFQQADFFRHNLLPEEHNDFIFAVIGHQWGFLGGLFVLTVYIVMFAAGLTIASMTTDPLGRLLAVGVCTVICAQMIVNIAMTVGLMPITGMTLPFASMGGSSLITNYMALGLLVSVARRRPLDMAPKPFEFDGED